MSGRHVESLTTDCRLIKLTQLLTFGSAEPSWPGLAAVMLECGLAVETVVVAPCSLRSGCIAGKNSGISRISVCLCTGCTMLCILQTHIHCDAKLSFVYCICC